MLKPEHNTFQPFTDGYHETGSQVHDWVLKRAREHFAGHERRKQLVTDRKRFEAYRAERRQRFLDIVGPLAEPEASPRVEIPGVLQRDGYEIRKLILRGRSGMPVAANAYVPVPGSAAPVPGVLMACGHSKEGKAAPKYQQVCIALVRAGMVVLTLDSPGHGEMVQCLDPATGQPLVGTNTVEHSYLQLAASVLNRNIMREFINNARAGLDWLAAQPEVDPARLGVTGNSGGGHMTQALMMVDDRVRAAVSCCSQTTREHYLETGIRAYDGEQTYFGCIPAGLDYDDFFASFAPRPVRIGAAGNDYFAIEGVLETAERARRIYRTLEAGDRIDVYVAEEEHHGYTAPIRRAAVEWFARHLLGKTVTPDEGDPPVETPETLQCTRTGQVLLDDPEAPSLLDLMRDEWRETRRRAASAPPPSSADLRRRLQLPATIEVPAHVRRTVRQSGDGLTADRIFFFSEPGILVTGVLYTPATAVKQATLLLIPDGTEGQAPYVERIHALLAAGHAVLVFDPRGTGAVRMRQRNPGEGLAFRSTEFRVASDHFLLGTSIAARRTHDVLRACAWLRSLEGIPAGAPVEVEAHGWPAIYGLLAAAADDDAVAGPLTGLPDSWEEVFALKRRDPERLSEPLIVPELGGATDLCDLHRLAAPCRSMKRRTKPRMNTDGHGSI